MYVHNVTIVWLLPEIARQKHVKIIWKQLNSLIKPCGKSWEKEYFFKVQKNNKD